MEVGTAEPLTEVEPLQRRRRASSGHGGQKGSGGNRNNGGGGGSGGDDGRADENRSMPSDKSRVVTWFLLLIVLMTFGGLIGAYIVVATNEAIEWKPFQLPFQVWVSTTLLLASSVTYEIAKRSFARNDLVSIRRYFVATTVLGALFISFQLLAWRALAARGLYMEGNPYAGFFYILTAAHAIHILGGIIALTTVLLRCWYPTSNSEEMLYRSNVIRSVGWYWHFVGAIWLVLLALLGLWN